jgi:hypothetical protein
LIKSNAPGEALRDSLARIRQSSLVPNAQELLPDKSAWTRESVTNPNARELIPDKLASTGIQPSGTNIRELFPDKLRAKQQSEYESSKYISNTRREEDDKYQDADDFSGNYHDPRTLYWGTVYWDIM